MNIEKDIGANRSAEPAATQTRVYRLNVPAEPIRFGNFTYKRTSGQVTRDRLRAVRRLIRRIIGR